MSEILHRCEIWLTEPEITDLRRFLEIRQLDHPESTDDIASRWFYVQSKRLDQSPLQ